MRKGLAFHLPNEVRPGKSVCYRITIPDDPWYRRAFQGSLFEMASALSWENDPAHRALEVAQVWLEIARSLKPGSCEIITPIGDGEGEQMLRVNPDNPCELQEFCGGDWVHFWGPEDCPALGGSSQPTGGGPLSPGECRTYDATLMGSGLWLLPVPVNPGDTIQIIGYDGGWTDGSGVWSCPNGHHYVLGACGSANGTSGSDPLPTAQHAQIIFQSDGVFYDPIAGPVGIPSGATADSDATFQMNDPSLSDNAGSVTFRVKVCSQPETPISLTYDEGSGPTSVVRGGTFVVTAEDTGFFQCNELYRLKVNLSPCVHLKLLSLSGYTTFACEGDNVDYAYKDCSGTLQFCRVSDGCNDPPANWPDTDAEYAEIASRTPFTAVFQAG